MIQGLIWGLFKIAGTGVLRLIYGKDGMELRKRDGKDDSRASLLLMIVVFLWFISALATIAMIGTGEAELNEDFILALAITILVPAFIGGVAVSTRKKVRETLASDSLRDENK